MAVTLVDPSQRELIAWFSNAEIDEQCHVVIQSQQTYMFLSKLSPVTIQWQMPVAMGKDGAVTGSLQFLELLQSWEGEIAQV